MKVRRCILLIIAILVGSLLVGVVTAEAKRKKVLFVGDSRVVGMKMACGSDYYFIGKGSVGVSFLDDKAVVNLDTPGQTVVNNLTSDTSGKVNLKSACNKEGIKTIVYELGVNSVGNTGAGSDTAIKSIKALKDKTGCEIIFMTVLPVDPAKYHGSVTNDSIEKFNKAVKKGVGSSATVVDTYKFVKEYKNWQDTTSDGLHFNGTLYKEIVKYVVGEEGNESISGNNGNTGGGSAIMNYDGSAIENPVCDSGFESSFEGASYYDMAIPYALTNDDVGGWATGENGSLRISDADKNKKVGSKWNKEFCHTHKSFNSGVASVLTITHNADGYCVGKDKNGTEYYFVAIGKYFYNSSSKIKWGEEIGQVIEIYFTDGKYIRAIVTDVKAVGHTNGGEGAEHKGTNQDSGHFYYFSDLKYPQYQNIYQAYAGEVFEWICSSNCTNKTDTSGIAGSSGSPAFVRMYDIIITKDTPKLTSSASKEAVGSRGSSGSNIATETQTEANAETGYVGGYYKESDLSSYLKLCEADIQGKYLDNTRRENLNQTYLEGLDNWERNVEYNKKDNGLISLLRKIVVGVGILFIVWTLLIYIAYWFDRLNSLFYVDMLSILTFGKLHISDTESECTFSLKDGNKTDKKTVNHKAILTVCLICLSFGFLLITGYLFKIVGAFVDFVLRILGRVA